MDALVIGVAGGSGSGKSTLLEKLLHKDLTSSVSVLYHDNYYKARDELTYEQRAAINYDEPDAFDSDLFVQHLALLKAGQAVQSPVYDFTQHNRSTEVRRVEPAKVILVDGILIFADARARALMDLRIFVDAPDDIRLLRRIRRDVRERGRSLESVLSQYENTVRPMHLRYVEPTKAYAHIIVPEGGMNEMALDLLHKFITARLAQ